MSKSFARQGVAHLMPTSTHVIWTRYVDNTFVILKRGQENILQARLNSVFPEIQFTMEEEKDDCFPFLDTLVARHCNGNLETHTDNMLHASTRCPTK